MGFSLSFAAGKDDPPFQRRTWKRANPSLEHFPDLEKVIRLEVAEAKRDTSSAMQSFRALRLNQGVADVVSSVLIDADTWRGAMELSEPEAQAREYVLGIDLGQNAAMSAASAYFADGRLEALAIFPELPSLGERGLSDGVGSLYVQMAQRGELLQAGRRVSDVAALLRECLERWGRPVAIVCDRWRVAELREKLEGVNFPLAHLVERGQGFKDGGADVRDFRAAVLAGKVQAIALAFVERRNGRSAGNGRPERKLEIGETHARWQAGEREG